MNRQHNNVVIEVVKPQNSSILGNLYPDNKHQSGNVYSVNGAAPTIMAGTHGYGIGAFVETRNLGNVYNEKLGEGYAGNVWDSDAISPTLTTMQGGGRQPMVVDTKEIIPSTPKTIKIRQATKEGFVECELPGVADLNYASSTTRRGRVQMGGQISPTLTTENIPSLIELGDERFYNFLYKIGEEIYLIRIRKLTPKECWRLMGFSDEDFENAEQVNSNTQLYKQAGNSIVKNVLMSIFQNMM